MATERGSRKEEVSMNAKFGLFLVPGLMLAVSLAGAGQTGAKSKTVWDGVYGEPQATRGQAVYAEYCAGCHGSNLGGGAAQGAPPLKGDKFMENWREDSVDSLFTKIKTTMPRRSSKTLTDAETLDIVSYLLQANEFPAGGELDASAIDKIQIQRKDGPKPLPNYAIVQVVGCMTADDDNWTLTMASPAKRVRNAEKSTPEELKAAASNSLGAMTFRLQNLAMLGAFDPQAHKGHKMIAKGSFSRQANTDRISVTELEMLGASCGQ